MTDSKLLDPTEYGGEILCACCGLGFETGNRYKICTDPGWTHEETCKIYDYGDMELCSECEKRL